MVRERGYYWLFCLDRLPSLQRERFAQIWPVLCVKGTAAYLQKVLIKKGGGNPQRHHMEETAWQRGPSALAESFAAFILYYLLYDTVDTGSYRMTECRWSGSLHTPTVLGKSHFLGDLHMLQTQFWLCIPVCFALFIHEIVKGCLYDISEERALGFLIALWAGSCSGWYLYTCRLGQTGWKYCCILLW